MPATTSRTARDWDELAGIDPLWAVLSDPARRHGRWSWREFLETAEPELDWALGVARRLGRPAGSARALDFGCGVGRVTGALAARFEEVWGVDVSPGMVAQARRLHAAREDCRFEVLAGGGPGSLPAAHFDLVYCNLVLQHLPSRRAIERHLTQLVRLGRPDGLVIVQLPNRLAVRNRIQGRSRLYALLRRLGLRPGLLYGRLGLHPIVMRALPHERAVAVLERSGARVLDAPRETFAGPDNEGRTYFVAPPASSS